MYLVCVTVVAFLRTVTGEIIFSVNKNETKDRIVKCGIDVAIDNFDFRQPTAVLYKGVERDYVSDFFQSYKGIVTVDTSYYDPPPNQIIILVKTLKSFMKVISKLKPDRNSNIILNSGAKYVIVLLDNQEVSSVTTMLWNIHILNVVIVTSKEDDIVLYSYFPYKDNNDCHNTDPVLVEYWSKDSLSHNDIFPDKLQNMQGCPLYISTNKLYQPENEKHNQIQTFKKAMITSLREIMNFTPSIFTRDYISIDSDRAKNWSDSLNDVIIGLANISTCTIPLGVDRLGLLDYSIPYFTVRLVWLAPPIKPGSTWWRLFSPLNGYLWLLILIVTSLVKCLPLTLELRAVRKFSYKYFKELDKLQGITIKMWGVMMGQPIRIFPKRFRDFYIIALWMWYTFVIRNVYQSVLIGALKTDSALGNFANLKETIENGYKFGGRASIYTHFKFDPLIRSDFILIQEEKFEQVFQDVLDGKINFVLSISLEYAYAYCLSKGKKETECGHLLPDSILSLPLVIWMKVNSPFGKPISLWLQRLIETGLLEREKNVVTTKASQLITDPSPLNTHQILSCMICLITGYVISTVAFLYEVFKFHVNKYSYVHNLEVQNICKSMNRIK